jgi:hypothetical protein
MYVVSEALRLMQKSGQPKFAAEDAAVLPHSSVPSAASLSSTAMKADDSQE